MNHRPPSRQSVGEQSAGERVDRDVRSIRVGAKALIADDRGHVLLIKERRSDGSTFWTLPGGGVQSDESFEECLHRELEEELRSRTTVGAAVASCTYEHESYHRPATLYHVFECELEDGPTPNRAEGIVEHAWVTPSDLPATTLDPFRRLLRTRTARQVIES